MMYLTDEDEEEEDQPHQEQFPDFNKQAELELFLMNQLNFDVPVFKSRS